jgi:membrane associated rhomboid family serine protease
MIDLGTIADTQQGGVAYMAHVGGAVFGAVTAKLFERRDLGDTSAGPYA